MVDTPLILTLGTTPTIARSMLFPAIKVDGVNRATQVREYAAGKAINAARAAATLGGRTLSLAPAAGARGAMFGRLLGAAGLSHRILPSLGETRLCITIIDEGAGTATELIEESPGIHPTVEQMFIDECLKALASPTVLVLSGSLAPGLNVDFYARNIEAANAAGRTSLLDASGQALRVALAARPTVVKINAGELAGIRSGDVVQAASSAAAETDGWIVVTRGRESTIAVHPREGTFTICVPSVPRVVSPIGSGDSFAGGMAFAIARGDTMLEAIRLGTACASANVMSADAAHFNRADVETLLSQIQIKPVH